MTKVKITVGGFRDLAKLAKHLADNCIDENSVTVTIPFKTIEEHRAQFVAGEAGNAGVTCCVERCKVFPS